MHTLKNGLCLAAGAVGAAVSSAFGGWNEAMTALVVFMAADYLTGIITAAVFHRSDKTADGTLESRAGWKGLCRKGVTLLIVLAAKQLDLLLGTTFVGDAAAIGFSANELLSVVENAGLMGIPVPRAVTAAIHVLKERADGGEESRTPTGHVRKEGDGGTEKGEGEAARHGAAEGKESGEAGHD